ncbi:MAG TPA: SRPBCC domain-containing protein [Opitutaceae bacterium]|nr:SRPBCC domain-containing protein [Opitutaceae bacterium]
MPSSKKSPVVVVEQLIRAPQASVFAAFTKPRKLKKFWLSKAGAPLEEGKTVQWHFKVRGVKDAVKVLALEPDRRIRVQWTNRRVTEWTFTALKRKKTLVRVEQSGLAGRRETLIAEAADTAQGFAFVLSDLKVLLERRIQSGIVKDKASVIEREMRAAKRKK